MSNFTNEQIFKEIEGRTLSYLLKKACYENDIDKIKYIFESDVLDEIFGIGKSGILSDTLEELEKIILDADLIKKCCELNHVEILKYFLSYCNGMNAFTIEDLQSQLNEGAVMACQKDSVEALDYILNSRDIELHAKIDTDAMFFYACANNCIRVLDFLFKEPKIEHEMDFAIRSNEILKLACAYSDLNTIKFILHYPEFQNKINIHVEQDNPFSLLINNRKEDVIEYFIFELKINKTEDISNLLEKKKRLDIEKMFETRDLKNELNFELKDNVNNVVKKIKV